MSLFTRLLSILPGPVGGRNRDFILIISIKYHRWTDSRGHSMQLNTVENDAKAILNHVGYSHNNSDGQCYYFLMDYDLEYTDYLGTTKLLPRTGLPTRELILETLAEATVNGSSGLIHYSGRCDSTPRGTSEIEEKLDCIIYKATEDRPRGPKAAYLISCDGKRIYGRGFSRFLHHTSRNADASIITLVLDTSEAEAFINDFENLPIIHDVDSVSVASTPPTFSTAHFGQLVVITATQADEVACAANDCGVLTYFLTECLARYPMASAVEVVQLLDTRCKQQPIPERRQHPRIWSRYPLNGPFRLIPRRNAPIFIEASAPHPFQTPSSVEPGTPRAQADNAPPPPPHAGGIVAVAMYDFEADGEDGLTVKEGEKLTVLDKEESDDWWKCRNSKGKEGVVPASYLETRVVEPNATLQPALPPDPVSELSSSSAGSPEPTFSKFDTMILIDDIGLSITWISLMPTKVNGHFCDVFEGTHAEVGKVALKRPRIASTGYDDVVIRRFEREAATWRRLRHPHILKFLGTFRRDGHIYFVSPFIQNGTLVEYIDARPGINRITLLCETADAVQYLHKEEVVHGDLKASNILVNDGGHSLLCDFGLTKAVDSRTSAAMQGAGTFRWQSPELWDNAPKSFESDVYAFGMTIAEVLTGKVPFHDLRNDVAVLQAVILRDERPPKIPAKSSSGISYERIWDVASDCWPKTPSNRIPMSEAFQRIRTDPSLTSSY